MSHIIGMDLGKSSVKYVAASGQGEVPAWLSRGRISQVFGQGNGKEVGGISYKGKDYIIGQEAVLGSGFSWSSTEDKDDLRNLIFALSILGTLGITEADMVIGLPVSAANNPAAISRIKSLLEGTHEIAIHGKPKVITLRVGVLPEPLGTYFSLVLDKEGRFVPSSFSNCLVGIVDIGYRTVDVVALEAGKLATTRDSTLSGITVLFSGVCKLLEQNHGKLRPNEIAKVHTWLTEGCPDGLTIGGEYVVNAELQDEVARQRDELAVQIMDEVQSLVSNIRPELIIITGGGAALLRRELVKIHPRLTHHPNPRYANAIGFYRAAVARGRGNAQS